MLLDLKASPELLASEDQLEILECLEQSVELECAVQVVLWVALVVLETPESSVTWDSLEQLVRLVRRDPRAILEFWEIVERQVSKDPVDQPVKQDPQVQ